MKTIVRLFCASALCLLSLSVSAQQKEVPAEFLGKWTFTFEDPQTGQDATGLCTVRQDKGETTALFELDYGSASTTAFRPNDNGKFYADMEIQGYPISLAFRSADELLICDLDGGSFFMSLEMKKEE